MHYAPHLSRDKKMKKLIREHGEMKLTKQKDVWLYLCFSIVSQQLSVKVARVIRQRFLDLYQGEPTPEKIIATPHDQLRGIGMSNAKTSYVKHVAQFQLEKGMDPKKLSQMDNEEVIEYLTEIKGVGRWTVEMLLMFALGREDVFAPDDLGLVNAVIGLYGIRRSKNKKIFRQRLEKHAETWAPYRTYASLYLWRWKDNVPVVKAKRK
jgi:DNA-3-methyladenine glycosylase II